MLICRPQCVGENLKSIMFGRGSETGACYVSVSSMSTGRRASQHGDVSESQMLRIIGGNIRVARLQAGLTQECLAELVGLHWQTVSNIERGLHPCGVTNFALLTQHIGVSADSLLKGVPPIDKMRAAKIRLALARKRRAR